jgi:rSAM/selenodomain-associated transferase 2
MSQPRVSVIIPTLNEAACIADTLRRVHALPGPVECIVADGQSDDETQAYASPYATVCTSPRGRGRQMNAGAAQANAPILLFLHADTTVPPATWNRMHRALQRPSVQAGTFRLSFDRPTPLLRFYAWCTHLNWWGFAFGDRGLFIRHTHFETMGGFAPLPIFEDLDMARRLCTRGGFQFVDAPVVTSARRFRAVGTLRQQMQNARLWLRYMTGTSPTALCNEYRYDADVRTA